MHLDSLISSHALALRPSSKFFFQPDKLLLPAFLFSARCWWQPQGSDFLGAHLQPPGAPGFADGMLSNSRAIIFKRKQCNQDHKKTAVKAKDSFSQTESIIQENQCFSTDTIGASPCPHFRATLESASNQSRNWPPPQGHLIFFRADSYRRSDFFSGGQGAAKPSHFWRLKFLGGSGRSPAPDFAVTTRTSSRHESNEQAKRTALGWAQPRKPKLIRTQYRLKKINTTSNQCIVLDLLRQNGDKKGIKQQTAAGVNS